MSAHVVPLRPRQLVPINRSEFRLALNCASEIENVHPAYVEKLIETWLVRGLICDDDAAGLREYFEMRPA